MKTPLDEAVLDFDFCLDRLDVALRAPDGAWLIHHQAYDNNLPGFLEMKRDVLAHLAPLGQVQLTNVGESTGLLWWHAFYQLATDPDFAPHDPRLALLNPAHVKNFRKALPEEEKCDELDPHLVDAYYRGHGVRHYHTFDPRYLPLRQLTRAYRRVTKMLAADKSFCLSLVYLLVSDYQRLKPFADTFGVTSQYILTEYPDVAAIAAIPLDDLAQELSQIARGHLEDPKKTAHKLNQVHQDSYPLPDFLAPTVRTVLGLTLERIRFLEGQKGSYHSLIETELDRLPEAKLALGYKGLGPILVGGCLGEIQDTRRFTTGRKYDRKRKRWRDRNYQDGQAAVAKMAGLWWPRNSSGRFEGQDRRLARERNPHLRYWFVQAAYSLKRHQEDYAAYYQRKYRESSTHPHKRALVLTARKATRLIFALLRKGQQQRLEEETAT